MPFFSINIQKFKKIFFLPEFVNSKRSYYSSYKIKKHKIKNFFTFSKYLFPFYKLTISLQIITINIINLILILGMMI